MTAKAMTDTNHDGHKNVNDGHTLDHDGQTMTATFGRALHARRISAGAACQDAKHFICPQHESTRRDMDSTDR